MLILYLITKQLTHWGLGKLGVIFRTTLIFLNENYFTEVCSRGSNQKYSHIGSHIGLAPTRQQAIIWANDG